jgi:hypothetical protein
MRVRQTSRGLKVGNLNQLRTSFTCGGEPLSCFAVYCFKTAAEPPQIVTTWRYSGAGGC